MATPGKDLISRKSKYKVVYKKKKKKLKDIRDETLASLGTPNPFRLTRASFLAELSRAWQLDNARIVVQWMTLVRAAAERPLQTFLPAAFSRVPAHPSSITLAANETAAGFSV